MFLFSPKLPVTEEDRRWVDEGFKRLESVLGKDRMLRAKAVLPIAEDFPDRFDKTEAAANALFNRVCSYMGVNSESIEFGVYADEIEGLRELLPYWRNPGRNYAAGLYFPQQHSDHTDSNQCNFKPLVAIKKSLLKDPLAAVATMAHEIGHVILLGGNLMDPQAPDHEPMTDLLTVFLGLGVFNANASARFTQRQSDRGYEWSMKQLGYLPEHVFGYALARFAKERGEDKPEWEPYLSTNVRSYFKSSRAWLAQ